MKEKTLSEMWADVAWHFRTIAIGCFITAGCGAAVLSWMIWAIYWYAPPLR